MSATWYKLRIEKQKNDYECYIRFKFDFQMQSIRIKSFLYLIDSEGNIAVTSKRNKLKYDPRIVGSLVIEKNFLKRKRRNIQNNKDIFFEVRKYQGNFNICNLPLIDDYFRNGKALICQYRDLINLMDNKKYKIQMSPKVFTIILDVVNYGYISLNLFNKLEDVEKQELIFLQQNEDEQCHRYFSEKFRIFPKNKRDLEEIEIIEENKNFNRMGGRILYNGEENENMNIDFENNKLEGESGGDGEGNYSYFKENENENDKDYDINSDDSSFYDNKFVLSENKQNQNSNKITVNIANKNSYSNSNFSQKTQKKLFKKKVIKPNTLVKNSLAHQYSIFFSKNNLKDEMNNISQQKKSLKKIVINGSKIFNKYLIKNQNRVIVNYLNNKNQQ